MKTKTYKAILDFDASSEPGEFEAVFATLNVVDHDGDVTLPGAFGEQKVLIEPWNHRYESPPVGKGEILERGEEAIVKGKYFLNTSAGDEHYKVAKELGDMQEWSYSFDIKEYDYGEIEGRKIKFLKKLDVIGVGQVMRGAGIGTRTTAIKGKKDGENSDAGIDTRTVMIKQMDQPVTEGEADSGKRSGPDADLMTHILAVEIGMIAGGLK